MSAADEVMLGERLVALEKQTGRQDEEITALKAELASAVKRITALEAKGSGAGRPAPSATTRPASARPSTAGPRPMASRNGPQSRAEPAASKPRASAAPAAKPSSARGVRTSSAPLASSGAKEPSYNAEEGTLKFYLRGRAINLSAPASIMENYNPKETKDAPAEKLKLEWVYGYRGKDCRSNIHYLPTGEIVYFVAATVVLYNAEEGVQRHYNGHNDDVKSLAVHPDHVTIASGQVAGHDKAEGKPHVRIWSSVNLQTLHVLGLGQFDRAVGQVNFSVADGGTHLAAVDESNEHVLSVWDWAKEKKLADSKSSGDPVFFCEWSPTDKNQLATAGKGHVAFWIFDKGLNRKMGIYEKNEKPKYVTALTYNSDGDAITGDSNGAIFVWNNKKVTRAVTGVHEGGVFCVTALKDGSFLSGGRDGVIKHWNADLSPSGQEQKLDEKYGAVRMLTELRGSQLAIGTTHNYILQGTLGEEVRSLVEGHTEELWGSAVDPVSGTQLITGAYDGNLIAWDCLQHTVAWRHAVGQPIHCVAIHKDGGVAALGTQAGKLIILDLSTKEVIVEFSDATEQIECCEFSPDGTLLAAGSRDQVTYVYQVAEDARGYNLSAQCKGHSSYLTHLDWSTDSAWIRTNSGDYEVLFWSAESGKQTYGKDVREVEWQTQYCTIDFCSVGIWPEGADGTDVNGCAKSPNNELLASADDYGKVNLYKFPAAQPKSDAHKYLGHSSHVTSVRFLADSTRLLSTGGQDTAVLQWLVV